MNDLELLRQLARETPLPAPAELDAARARLVTAIAAEAASGSGPAGAEATMDQRPASAGRLAGPPQPAVPTPVLTAVKFMHAGAIGTAAYLIVALALAGDIKAYHLTVLGHHLTTAQLGQLRPLIIALVIALGLAVIALWLWMARAASQGKSWARAASTVLFGLATLELAGNNGVAQAFVAVLTWLTGLAAIWLLWRPASSAFFRSAKALRSRPPSQISGP
jgi:hypothetical protein